jgi:hypothetical protein
VVTGVLSSLIFAYCLMFIRPRISVSTAIAKGRSDGQTAYKIKIRNLRRRKVIDLEAELFIAKSVLHPGGMAEVTEAVQLKRDSLLELSARTKGAGDFPNHVWRFITYDAAIEDALSDDSAYLRFTVTGKDTFSGKTQSFSARTRTIKEGEFLQGESFEIQAT